MGRRNPPTGPALETEDAFHAAWEKEGDIGGGNEARGRNCGSRRAKDERIKKRGAYSHKPRRKDEYL